MSWLFSQALVAEYSAANCSGGEPCAQLSVMPTPHKFWRNDKMMDALSLSRFGLTCAVLTVDRGEALLTWYLAGFRARTSAQQEKVPESKVSVAGCGLSSLESWVKYDPVLCLWRTPQLSLLGDSDEFSGIWPTSGLMRRGECYPLPSSERRICAKEYGLLPTPLKSWGKRGPGLSNNLGNLRMSLGSTLASLAIVKAVGWRWPATFVEWMMGWPLQWSALKPSETDKFRLWLQQHSAVSPDIFNGGGDVFVQKNEH